MRKNSRMPRPWNIIGGNWLIECLERLIRDIYTYLDC
jgi:hypothetical protein